MEEHGGSNLSTICSLFSSPGLCRPVTMTLLNLCTSWPSLAVITWNKTTLFHSCRYWLQHTQGGGWTWQCWMAKLHWLGWWWCKLDLIFVCPAEAALFHVAQD